MTTVTQVSDRAIEIRVDAHTSYRVSGPYDVYSLSCIAHEKPEGMSWFDWLVAKGLSFHRRLS